MLENVSITIPFQNGFRSVMPEKEMVNTIRRFTDDHNVSGISVSLSGSINPRTGYSEIKSQNQKNCWKNKCLCRLKLKMMETVRLWQKK